MYLEVRPPESSSSFGTVEHKLRLSFLGGSLVLGLLRLVRVVVWLGFRCDTIPIRTVRSEHAKVADQ